MTATITRYTVFTARDLDAIQAQLDAALRSWLRAWLPPQIAPAAGTNDVAQDGRFRTAMQQAAAAPAGSGPGPSACIAQTSRLGPASTAHGVALPPWSRVNAIANANPAHASAARPASGELQAQAAAGACGCVVIAAKPALQRLVALACCDRSPQTQLAAPDDFVTTLSRDVLSSLAASIVAAAGVAGTASAPGISSISSDSSTSTIASTASDQSGSPLSTATGSGTVIACAGAVPQALRIILSQELAWRLAGQPQAQARPAALTPAHAAIGHAPLTMRVLAGQASLRLADLLQLAPGDVLRLDLQPGAPFPLDIAGVRCTAAQAWLGQLDGHKAIQLTQPPRSIT